MLPCLEHAYIRINMTTTLSAYNMKYDYSRILNPSGGNLVKLNIYILRA